MEECQKKKRKSTQNGKKEKGTNSGIGVSKIIYKLEVGNLLLVEPL